VGVVKAVIAAGIGIGAVALALSFTLRHDAGGPVAAAHPVAEEASPSCESRLLRDWADGRIDGTYPLRCYRSALRSLPADLRVYSSAPDDIAQALSERILQRHHRQKISGHQGASSVRKIASAR
jgi:hypothetical protein